jgi:predicted RNase H-like HicB family nuclease
MVKIRVLVDYDPNTRSYAAYCPELPGCTSCGDTKDEALRNIREAIDLYLEPSPIEPSPTRTITQLNV